MVDPVGYRFHPTDEEIVRHYVRPKNLESNTSHVDQVMNTVDIYEFDPWELPCKSKKTSTDEVWYFIGFKKNQQSNRGGGERQSRRTKSGFWKKTGETMNIWRKRGDGEKIGEKRVFVFQYSKVPGGPSKKPKSDWVMHEYIATFLSPPNQTTTMMTTYTVCKVIFKGDPRDLSSSSSSAGEFEHDHTSLIPHVNNNNSGVLMSTEETEVNHPRLFTGFLHLEEEAQFQDEMLRVFNNLSTDDWNYLFSNDEEEQGNSMFVQEDRNDYRPKKPLTGFITDDDDSDFDSITTTTTCSIKTSSTCVSFGSSNPPTDQIIYLPEHPCSIIKSVSLTQETLGANTVISEKKMSPCDDEAQVTEIGVDQMGQEIKRAGSVYRMIQRFTKKIKLCSCVSRI